MQCGFTLWGTYLHTNVFANIPNGFYLTSQSFAQNTYDRNPTSVYLFPFNWFEDYYFLSLHNLIFRCTCILLFTRSLTSIWNEENTTWETNYAVTKKKYKNKIPHTMYSRYLTLSITSVKKITPVEGVAYNTFITNFLTLSQ